MDRLNGGGISVLKNVGRPVRENDACHFTYLYFTYSIHKNDLWILKEEFLSYLDRHLFTKDIELLHKIRSALSSQKQDLTSTDIFKCFGIF